jgi:putative ABC transport system substrate-binding protein
MVYCDEANAIYAKNQMQNLCQKNGVKFIGQMVAKQDEVKQACQIIANRKIDAIIVGADGVVVPQINAMIEVANAKKIPLYTMDEATVEAGAFAALSVNYVEFGKETARLTDVVIKNNKALPENQKIYLGKDVVLNLKTASVLGIKIPQETIINAYKTFE